MSVLRTSIPTICFAYRGPRSASDPRPFGAPPYQGGSNSLGPLRTKEFTS